MGTISQLVKQVLRTGYLTLEVEEQLRRLVQCTKYGREDFDAFVKLQLAAKAGKIRQESRECLARE
ncbi:MAG: hypothetical protein HC825_03705 [Oscillatoriales cyanobacterium RM1_1_9]|nr:hypothetical protein [Oscillatoriales cyanobacterium SM2_3_0]NJO47470.1 hypothetical protein [Oscillatoriales cyanobacterium RM2_1_1]NJO71039.1 hypothetical protein [Oscillatoriales cyanobacterium RM1_1_9]